jgi:hypothetical protein
MVELYLQSPIRFHGTGTSSRTLLATVTDIWSEEGGENCIRTRFIMIKSRMRWAGHVAQMGPKRNAYRLLLGKQEGKRPLGRPRRRWVDDITMDLGEVGWGDVDWIGLAQDRNRWRALVNSVMNLQNKQYSVA